jgi:hypothetical protein
MVVIDADTGDLDRRRRQFQGALDEAGMAACTDGEAIAQLVPKRNIETWILCLSGRHVDEDADYSEEAGIDELIAASAATFFAWSRVNITPPAHCVPSLLAAIPEVRRLG